MELVDAIDDVFLMTLSLGRDLTEADADRPTGCPGWTVRDQFAHMVGLEQVLNGAPEPDVELPEYDHVKNQVAEYMERHVEVRRRLPLAAICDELDGLRRRRIATLRALAERGDPEIAGPRGSANPMSKSLPIRVFDLWIHEQDIRRAVGLPVRDDCEAARVALDQTLWGWSRALGSKLEGTDATVSVAVTRPNERTERFELGAGGPNVTISGSLADLTSAFCGRDGAEAEIEGDRALADTIGAKLAMTP